MKNYDLFLHWKQGDDFNSYLNKEGTNISEALRNWATSFEKNAEHCRKLADEFEKLADEFENKNIKAFGDAHYIWFEGDQGILEFLAEKKLVNVEEI